MLALAGIPLGYRCVFVDPSPNAPAAAAGEQIACGYGDPLGQDALAECQVVTYEFESVPVEAAEALAARVAVFPPPFALRVAQDRLAEKNCFRLLGIGSAPFEAVDSLGDLMRAVENLGLPAVLKTRRFGYDGKGQFVLESADDVTAAWAAVGEAPSILEGFVRFDSRAESNRRAGPRWRDRILPAGRKSSPTRHFEKNHRPSARADARPASRRRNVRDTHPRAPELRGRARARTVRDPRPRSWSTRSPHACTTPAIIRSRARIRANSKTTCARFSVCPWATLLPRPIAAC